MPRNDGRAANELREVKITRGFIGTATGSALIETGRTRVVVTATVENRVPRFLVNTGRGWLSAEYAMLPGSTNTRKPRDGRRGAQVDGRNVEIQRLIGRSFRSIIDLEGLGQRTIWLDCDVIEADGGTRTAAINGAYVALHDACLKLREEKILAKDPLRTGVAAVSVGMVEGRVLLDLDYSEDSSAEGDFNFVMTHEGDILSIQGGCEQSPIDRACFDEAVAMAEEGVKKMVVIQNSALMNGT